MATIFSKIISGEIKADIVATSAHSLAFLDIEPLSSGHTLVIPKREVPNLLELPDMELNDLFLTVRQVVAILSKSLKPDGFTIGINHGAVAGQAIAHLHIHVIPRYKGDGGSNIHSLLKKAPHLSLEKVREKIKLLNK